MGTLTLGEAIDRHGVDVLEHLDRDLEVPVLTGLQLQGDVAVVPVPHVGPVDLDAGRVPAEGIPVVRGEAGGNTHLLLADGDVRFYPPDVRGLAVGLLVVQEATTAFLAHPEHGYLGVGPGFYEIRRQREQAEEERLVAD
jgi:hypothetical protein